MGSEHMHSLERIAHTHIKVCLDREPIPAGAHFRNRGKGLDSHHEMTSDAERVDWFGVSDAVEGQLKRESAYVISTLSDSDKRSEGFDSCIGFVLAGTDRKNRRVISCMGHIAVIDLLSPRNTQDLRFDLNAICKNILAQCAPQSIDAIIFGGAVAVSKEHRHAIEEDGIVSARRTVNDDYVATVDLIAREVRTILHIEPTVVVGPKEYGLDEDVTATTDDVFFDTQRRRLYLYRSSSDTQGLAGDMPAKEAAKVFRPLADL